MAKRLTRIEKFRKIVADCQRAKIDGTNIDLFSASAVVKVYDALNEENRAKFASVPAPKMVAIAWRLINNKS